MNKIYNTVIPVNTGIFGNDIKINFLKEKTMGKKRFVLLFVTIFLIAYLFYISSESKNKQIILKISSKKAYEMMQKNLNNPNFIIIDVRTESEFKQGHIKNAVNINYNDAGFKNNLEKLDKNKTYLVYCRSGNRSAKAVNIMKELDFLEVYDFGGIIEWGKEGYKLEK